MTKAITYTYNIAQENCRQITTVLLGLCLVLTMGYAINIYRVVSHTVALKQVTSEAAQVNSALQTLDAEYAAISAKITPDFLAVYGFDSSGVDNKAFITRTSSLGLSFAGHEL